MSAKSKPRSWVIIPVLAAASWITFRVMAAPPPPLATIVHGAGNSADDDEAAFMEVDDPALGRMIARFAAEAEAARR